MPPSSVPPAAGKVPAAPTTGTADSAPSLEDDAATLDDIYGSANYWQRSTTPAAKGAESAPSAPRSSSVSGKPTAAAATSGNKGPVQTFTGVMGGLAVDMAGRVITAAAAPKAK